jgi:hypothetical protein
MDWSKVSRSTWIVVGGTAAAVLGALVFDWYSVSIGPFSASINAWDVNAVGKLAVLGSLVMLAGAVVMFVPNAPELPVPLPMAMLIASGFTVLMVIIEFLDHHSHTAFGLWLTLIGGIVAAYGAYEMGGRVSVPTSSSSS